LLSQDLADRAMIHFDESINKHVTSQELPDVEVRGHLHTYRLLDRMYTLISDAAIVTPNKKDSNRVFVTEHGLRIVATKRIPGLS